MGEYYIESNRCIEDVVRERGGAFPTPTKQENLVSNIYLEQEKYFKRNLCETIDHSIVVCVAIKTKSPLHLGWGKKV